MKAVKRTNDGYIMTDGYTGQTLEGQNLALVLNDKYTRARIAEVSNHFKTVHLYYHRSDLESCLCIKCKNGIIAPIARTIKLDWNPVWFGAVPYLNAMQHVEYMADPYGVEDGRTQVIYFLSNATTWRGPVAKLIKKELNHLAGLKRIK